MIENLIVCHLQFSVNLDIHVLQEGQVQLLANDIRLSLLQVDQAAVVRLLDGPQEVVADVVTVILGRANGDLLAVLLEGIAPVVLLCGARLLLRGITPSWGQMRGGMRARQAD